MSIDLIAVHVLLCKFHCETFSVVIRHQVCLCVCVQITVRKRNSPIQYILPRRSEYILPMNVYNIFIQEQQIGCAYRISASSSSSNKAIKRIINIDEV